MKNISDNFIISGPAMEVITTLPNKERLEIYDAISAYALQSEERELLGISKALFILIKPQLDGSRKKHKPKAGGKKVNNANIEIYKGLATGLKFVLENKLDKTIGKITNWDDEIRKLVEIDLKDREDAVEDVKTAIRAIAADGKDKFFPVVESGSSLRSKFSKIENYLQKKNNTPTLSENDQKRAQIEARYEQLEQLEQNK